MCIILQCMQTFSFLIPCRITKQFLLSDQDMTREISFLIMLWINRQIKILLISKQQLLWYKMSCLDLTELLWHMDRQEVVKLIQSLVQSLLQIHYQLIIRRMIYIFKVEQYPDVFLTSLTILKKTLTEPSLELLFLFWKYTWNKFLIYS